jgi:hypothetical protein
MKTMRWFIVVLIAGMASAAHAQTPSPAGAPQRFRGYISVDGGYQGGTEDFGTRGTFPEFLEEGSFDADHDVDAGPQFQGSGGVGVWKNLYAGVAVSRFSRRTPARVNGSVPHPFFFARNRLIEGEATGLTREELAVHLQARALIPVSRRIDIALFGGPSWFNVSQGVVGGIEYNQSYPFDTAEFRSATTSAPSASRVGFNAGADAAFFFTRHLGVGGAVQVARADVELDAGNERTVVVKAGGIQGGVGLRIRF